MLGPILIVVVLLVALPVATLILAGVVTALLGSALNADSAAEHEGHELLPLNN